MLLERYLQKIQEQKNENDDLKKRIMDFFKENPNPQDSQINKFIEDEDIDKQKFEEIIYSLLSSFLGAGLAKDFTGSYDPKQLEMGIKVEMEHTIDPMIAERIAKDHLAEIPTYYTYLKKMEEEAEAQL